MQICCHGNMLALSRGFGVWRKTSDTCCISSRKTPTRSLQDSLSRSPSLSPSLSASLSPSLSPSLSLSCSAFLALPLLFPLLFPLPLSFSFSLSLSLFLSLSLPLSLALKCIKPCKAIAPLPKKKSLWSQVHPSNQMAGLSTSWITCWMLDAAIVPKSIIWWPWMQHGYFWWKNNVALCLVLFQQGFSHVWCSYIHHCFNA